jgi:hypothetical protein
MEAAIVFALGLNKTHTHVIILPQRQQKLSTWDASKQRLCIPRDLALSAPLHASSWAIAVHMPPEAGPTWHLFVVDGRAARAGKWVVSNMGKSKLVQLTSPAPVLSGWAYFPWPRLTPPLGFDLDVTQASLSRLLALSLQGAAEWLFYICGPRADDVEARLLAQYGTDECALADTLFNTLVLPYARGVRLRAHKRLRDVALPKGGSAVVVVDCDELLQCTSLQNWLRAGWAQAAAFERLAPASHVECLRREGLNEHAAAMRRLLPGPALAWVTASRAWAPNTPDDLLTQLTGEGPGGFARDYRQTRADLGRLAIVRAGQHRPPSAGEALVHWKQQRLFCAPFVGSWDAAQGGGPQRWAVLADAAARLGSSNVSLIQSGAIRAAVDKQRHDEQERRGRALYYRDKGLWHVGKEDRLARLSALGVTAAPGRLVTFFLKHPYVPACLKAVLARGRGDHHLFMGDRLVLGPWLAALLPAPDPDKVQMLTEFALALAPTDAATETSEALAATITQAANQRTDKTAIEFATGYACNGVIKHTLGPDANEERCACRCPYAALRQPSVAASGGWDNGPCVRACGAAVKEAAKGDPKIPLSTWHPLDRLLWARETGVLEW